MNTTITPLNWENYQELLKDYSKETIALAYVSIVNGDNVYISENPDTDRQLVIEPKRIPPVIQPPPVLKPKDNSNANFIGLFILIAIVVCIFFPPAIIMIGMMLLTSVLTGGRFIFGACWW